MTTQQNRWVFVAAFTVIVIGVALVSPPQPVQPSKAQLAELHTAFYQATSQHVSGLNHFQSDVESAFRRGPIEEADINQLLRDFPTAAGAIHSQVILDQQYLAAVNGNYEQAMRLMAMSFVSGAPSGSYDTKW